MKIADPVLDDRHEVGHVAGQYLDALLEALQRARLGIVARQNAARMQLIAKGGDYERQKAIGALRERLNHEVVTVSIHDDRWQQIGFAMNEAVSRRIDRQRMPKCQRGLDSLPQESLVRLAVTPCEHADRNLRSIAEQRVAECPAAGIANEHPVARAGVRVDEVAAVYPGVPAS